MADSRLEALNEVARIATLDLELRPMLQRITDALARRFGWEFVALVSVDADHEAFRCEALTTAVPTDVTVGYSRPVGSGVVGQVAATLRPLVLDDVRSFPNYVETMSGALSEICVPVLHKGQLVALLNLESRRLAAFHDQLPLLTTVADQIAGAIANARAHEELKQRALLMQMMSEVSRTALEATDLPQLLHRIVAYIHQHFPLEIVAILLHDAEAGEYEQTANAGNFPIVEGKRFPLTHGVIGRCLRTGQQQLVLDARADPDYVPILPQVRAELVVPIRFGAEILGVLNLETSAPDVFDAASVLAFEAFADQVAGAIHLASVNARLAETSAQLEQKRKALEEANEHLASAIETLHRISTLDGLTGVSNRRHFDETLALEWRRAARTRLPISLLLLDIDHFKSFNDVHGHQAGDECLRRVAQTLKETLHRAADFVARYGGEELAVLLPDTDTANAARIAENIRTRVEALGDVTISAGVATSVPERDASDSEAFVKAADEALYEAKRLGRNRVVAGA